MNYQEAIDLKRSIGDEKEYKSMLMKVFVSPSLQSDLALFLKNYLDENYTDETAKRYSSNGKFNVVGFWTDGANVVHKLFN